MQDFYKREDQKISTSQRLIEKLSLLIGQPTFLGATLVVVVLWVAVNLWLHQSGHAFDEPPFHLMQGLVGLGALVAATVVLIKQNRLAGIADQRAHLDLKVTLLTEQKAAKLIDLLEELRRDLPNVNDREDPVAVELKNAMNPKLVLAALDADLSPAATPPAAPPAVTPG